MKLLRDSKSLASYINSPIRKGFVSFLFTVKSLILLKLTRYLLSQPGVRFLLTVNDSAKALLRRAFFGIQRAKGGCNYHPAIKRFIDNTVSFRVQGSAELNPETAERGN